LLIVDCLLHCAIEDQQSGPPATPADGQAWLIGTTATGAWSGHDDQIALRQLGQWLFVAPRDGMRVLNKTTGQWLGRVSGTWHAPATPAPPTGGSMIDSECRSALAAVIAALRSTGVLPA